MAEEDGFWENIKQGDIGGFGRNLWEGARDDWFGIDDFGRVISKAREGDFLGAAKSLGTGLFEIGGTVMMVVPGGQVVALASKGGKAGKALNLIRPLATAERTAAKELGKQGVKRGLVRGGGQAVEKGTTRVPAKFRNMLNEVGYGRGGVAGSAVRGLGQVSGLLPTSQGRLATGLVGGRFKAPYLSGKLTPLAVRTGVDENLTGLTAGGPPSDNMYRPVQYTPLDILYMMAMQNSPRSA
jgi:hypothetical protein